MNRPNGRVRRLVAAGLATACALVCVSAVSAWAGTITAPANNFNVPDDGTGNPAFFTVTASGMPANSPIFIEICDGVPASTLNWSPSDHCDAASGNAPAFSNAAGDVSFLASDSNRRLIPFKGESPQSLFNCNSSFQTPPSNLLDNYTNCQVRVATSTAAVTTDQTFITINLPNGPNDTTTSTSSTSTTSTSTSSSTSTTSTTIPTPVPTCSVASGPLKNPPGATLKANPGLLTTASAKKTSFTAQASLTNCTNFGAFTTKYPISAGKLKITVQVPPGSSCDNITPGFPLKTTVTITFQGVNPKTGKLTTAATLKTTLASYSQASSVPLAVDMVGQPVTTNKSPFLGKVTNFHLTVDEDAATRTTGCAAKGGVKVLHLNNGPSTLALSS